MTPFLISPKGEMPTLQSDSFAKLAHWASSLGLAAFPLNGSVPGFRPLSRSAGSPLKGS